ncbi:MAG: BON domain-containing protein [Sulfuritalea sp.]|nr:BON domain-containing protein [Sulfuritalea sp.]
MNALTTPVRPSAILKLICSATALILVSACDSRPPDTLATAPVATSVGTKIDDGIVTARVKSALLADADVKSFDLKVETRKGEVMLSGFVGNQAHVDRAILVTRGVEGVQLVTNNMTLKDGPATIGNTVDDGKQSPPRSDPPCWVIRPSRASISPSSRARAKRSSVALSIVRPRLTAPANSPARWKASNRSPMK